MFLKDSFDEFLKTKINLDQTRKGRIISAHNSIRDYLKGSEGIKEVMIKTYLQGSYAMDTAIKPCNETDEYDVDVVLEVDWNDEKGKRKEPGQLKKLIKEALCASDKYKDKILPGNGKRCITINYEGDFHLDILPAHTDNTANDTSIEIIYEWSKSNPKGFIQWTDDLQKESNNNYKDVVKLLKYWTRIQFGENTKPKSMLLSALAGFFIYKEKATIDKAFVDTISFMSTYLEKYDKVPFIPNPSLTKEDLARDWNDEGLRIFKDRLKKAVEKGKEALKEKSEEKTIEIWNASCLFKDTFPKKLYGLAEEAKTITGMLSNGTLKITQTGIVNSMLNDGNSVIKTEFFGER